VIRVHGVVESGIGAWRPRMERFPDVFRQLTGAPLFPGTLNIRIDHPLAIRGEFRIAGAEIGEPEQDMLFERCTVNGIAAYRLRPFQPATGLGGHGDHILEIVAVRALRPLLPDSGRVVVEFPRGKPVAPAP
jgi:CTP-dependent riboflavin kinase